MFMLIFSRSFIWNLISSFLPINVVPVFPMLGRIRCMLKLFDLIMLLPFGLAYGNIRECNLSLLASNISNWFVETYPALMLFLLFP